MKKISLNTVFGIMAMLFGFWRIFECHIFPFDNIFSFIAALIMAIPEIFVIYYSFRLLKEKTKKNIKGTVGSIIVIGALFFSLFIQNFFSELERTGNYLSLFIATLIAIPIYVIISKILMIKEGLSPIKGEFVGRGIVTIIALQIWIISSQMVDHFAPVEKGYTHIKEEPWESVGTFGSIFIAWVFYKVAMLFIKKSQKVEQIDGADGDKCPQF